MKYFGAFVAAAFWHTNQVKLYSLIASNGIEFLCQTPSLSSPVRSIILHYMTADSFRIKDKDSHLCLFAGLADGSVVTFEMVVNEESGATELKDMSVASLGQLPVTFSAYETGGKRVVVATGSRAVVFSWERSHLRAVPVMLKVPKTSLLKDERKLNNLDDRISYQSRYSIQSITQIPSFLQPLLEYPLVESRIWRRCISGL